MVIRYVKETRYEKIYKKSEKKTFSAQEKVSLDNSLQH
jgi:hypothetical protein